MATAAKFRIDVAIHLLVNSNKRPPMATKAMVLTLPEPVFPRFPDRLKDPGPETPPEKRKEVEMMSTARACEVRSVATFQNERASATVSQL